MKKSSFSKLLMAALVAGSLSLTGCGDSSEDFVFTNTNVVTAPTANNDAFNSLGNSTVTFNAASGVLANDVTNGATINAFDATGDQGGTLVLNADGSLSYTPVFGFVGQENFSYTLQNTVGSSTGTITFQSTTRAFFVDNSGANGTGAQGTPFNNLNDALNAAAAGETVFVRVGDGTATNQTGPFTVPPGVNLIGEGAGLVAAQTVVAQGQNPVVTGPFTCGGNNTISGLTLDGQARTVGPGIIINGVADVTVSACTFQDNRILDVDIDNNTGTVTLDGNTFGARNGNDFFRHQSNVSGNISVVNNTFTDNTTDDPVNICEINYSGAAVGTVTITGNTADNPNGPANGIDFGFEVLAFGTSQLTVDIQNNQLSNLDDAGVCVEAAGTATIAGTISGNTITNCGAGMDLRNSNGTLTLDNNRIQSSGGNGIQIAAQNTASFIISNSDILMNGQDGVSLLDGGGDLNVALRNNTITGNATNSLHTEVTNITVCLEIIGNTLDGVLRFERFGTGITNIEQLAAGLDTVNTFQGAAVFIPHAGTNVVSVAAGFCGLP